MESVAVAGTPGTMVASIAQPRSLCSLPYIAAMRRSSFHPYGDEQTCSLEASTVRGGRDSKDSHGEYRSLARGRWADWLGSKRDHANTHGSRAQRRGRDRGRGPCGVAREPAGRCLDHQSRQLQRRELACFPHWGRSPPRHRQLGPASRSSLMWNEIQRADERSAPSLIWSNLCIESKLWPRSSPPSC